MFNVISFINIFRGILSNFIWDPSIQSALPIFCLCDAEDGERTSILGIEKGKNKELSHYKITVGGPFISSHPSIQLDQLKSEMKFMASYTEVHFQTLSFFYNVQ